MESELNDVRGSLEVAISGGHEGYPSKPPYSPGAINPEYPFDERTLVPDENEVYTGVRDALWLLGLDAASYGKKAWNPLGEIIRPGQTVVLKPNFIRDFRETHAGHEDCVITHGSIIRAALDYVYIALKGQGRIIVADAPQNDADFEAIRRIAGLGEIQVFYREHAGFDVEVYDLRPERARKVDGVIVGHEPLPGDPAGYVKVDLGRHSMFAEVEGRCHLLYGSEYDTSEIRRHHTGGVHEYMISKTILGADCVINLPKLKTHKKTGITVCMKNLVGISGNKNWLPHHREGTPSQGGDQYADDGMMHRIERKSMECFRRVFPLFGPLRQIVAGPIKSVGKHIFGDTNKDAIRSGNWYGNDTTWRMAIDLNRILLYADKNGTLRDRPARHVFCIVDGIVGGEGNGPLDPTPKATGLVVVGENPAAVDLACARIMGFDPSRLPLVTRPFDAHPLPITSFAASQVIVHSTDKRIQEAVVEGGDSLFSFRPYFGWVGHCESRIPSPPEVDHGIARSSLDEWVVDIDGGNDLAREDSTEILFLGDVVLAGEVGDTIRQQGMDFLFERVPRDFFNVDVLCYNLECSLSRRGEVWEPKPVPFRGEPEFLSVFPKAKCKYVANVSNNHFLDYGEDAALDTLEALAAHGMRYFGAVGTAVETQRHIVLETRSGNIGLVGFTPSGHPLPKARRVNVASDGIAEMVSHIRLLKDQSDVVIVSLHQGVEHTPCVDRQCRQRTHSLIDAGADCVICHHPHIIQGIEMYQGVPIFHSIGNFAIGLDFMRRPSARKSLALRLVLCKRRLRKIIIEPFSIMNSLQPRRVTTEEMRQIRRETEALSSVFDSQSRTHIQHMRCRGRKMYDHVCSLCEMVRAKGVVSTTRYYSGRIMALWK